MTVEQLRAAVEASQLTYVDEHCIDCDAKEFWAVIAAALEKT